MIFNPQLLTALSLVLLGVASLIPFIAGMLGFSRRVSYVWATTLMCAFIFLEAKDFSPRFNLQEVFGLLLSEAGNIVVGAAVLLFAFTLAHWLGERLRTRTRG